jgi:hypothetical protein
VLFTYAKARVPLSMYKVRMRRSAPLRATTVFRKRSSNSTRPGKQYVSDRACITAHKAMKQANKSKGGGPPGLVGRMRRGGGMSGLVEMSNRGWSQTGLADT